MTKPMVAGALAMLAMNLGGITPHAEQAFEMRAAITTTDLTLAVDGIPVCVYRFADVPRKPYLEQWFTPAGMNILRDAPADHLHHHGLMFAIKVNGINFWEETEDTGHQVPHGPLSLGMACDKGAHTGTIDQELAWHGPDSDDALLIERRRIVHAPPADPRMRMLTWQSTLRPADGDDSTAVILGGRIYHGLGMRFPAFMDHTGTFLFADDLTGAFDDGPNHRLAQARWCAYTVNHPAHPVTVAMFNCPGNPRPTLWFTMRQPFAYLSATQNLMRAPMELPAGTEVMFRHGVAVWDAVVEEVEIESAYQAWLKTVR